MRQKKNINKVYRINQWEYKPIEKKSLKRKHGRLKMLTRIDISVPSNFVSTKFRHSDLFYLNI